MHCNTLQHNALQEAVAIVKEVLPQPCQKITNLKKGSAKMTLLLHSVNIVCVAVYIAVCVTMCVPISKEDL